MSDSEKKSKKDEKREEQTKEEQKGKKKEDEPLAPISAVSTVLFVLKVSLLSLVIVGGVVLFMGWKQLAVITTSPSALSPLIAQHMGRGAFVPVYIESRSLNVFVSSVGVNNGSEETVLFLHRLPGSSLSFSAAQDDLAREGIASLALDLPGFGLSDKPSDVSYTLDFLAQATVEALTSLHVDKVHLVAFGESCFVAARIGERFGHVISSLALIDCEVPPTRSPPLPLFAFEHSPALPLFAYSLLFGGPLKDESTAVAAANRWLTVYKGGQTAYFSFCTASGGGRLLGDSPFRGQCSQHNCAITGNVGAALPQGLVALDESLAIGKRIAKFVKQLPADVKQNKPVRPPPKVQYVQTGAGDKYGSGEHGHGHDDAHQHGAGCNH